MLNEKYILMKIEPYLNTMRELSEMEFDVLFSELTHDEQLEILNIMIEHNIDYVEDREVKTLKHDQSKESKSDIIFHDYKKLIGLTNEQLCVIFQKGDKAALAALIEKNRRFIYQMAIKLSKKYKQSTITIDDMFQEGCIGLMEAAERFDIRKDYKFTTYSWHWIRQKIDRAIIDTGYTIRIPVHLFEKIAKVNICRNKNPNVKIDQLMEIIYATYGLNCFTKNEVLKSIEIAEHYLNNLSYNVLVGDDNSTELLDFISDFNSVSTEDKVVSEIMKEDIDSVISTLTPREKDVIQLRFGMINDKEMTLEEIGHIYGVTRERIRQIEEKALRKLRHPSRSNKLKSYL